MVALDTKPLPGAAPLAEVIALAWDKAGGPCRVKVRLQAARWVDSLPGAGPPGWVLYTPNAFVLCVFRIDPGGHWTVQVPIVIADDLIDATASIAGNVLEKTMHVIHCRGAGLHTVYADPQFHVEDL